MATILLTLDDSDASHHAALVAAGLFGDAATYLAVHVRDGAPGGGAMWWPVYGYPYPVLGPEALSDAVSRRSAISDARRVASERAAAAGVEAVPIGETGPPAERIAHVAREHAVDVVVVGDHARSWFRTLVDGNVTEQLVRRATVPVLVVPMPIDEPESQG